MTRKIDSPLASNGIWNNNYWLRDKKPDCVFVHIMCAPGWSSGVCGAYFARSKVSSNYGIGFKGDICQYVEESRGAFAQGSKYWNKRGISIELANSGNGSKGWPVSDDTLESCIELVADIFIRRGLGHVNYTGTTKGNLLMHKWVAATSCPGPSVAAKFPHIAAEANKIINNEVRIPERGYFIKGDHGRSVRILQRWLRKQGFYKGFYKADIGTYKSLTVGAVKKFQRKYGLTVDGEFGNECYKKYLEVRNGKH